MTAAPPTLTCRSCGFSLPLQPIFHGCPSCRDAGRKEPLEVTYDLDALRRSGLATALRDVRGGVWTHRALLPLPIEAAPISLVEGDTPLVPFPSAGPGRIWVKDETRNPTGAHKDRFHSVSVSMARHFGFRKVTAATTGNHGLSATAYATAGGLQALIFCDPQSPPVLREMINFFDGRVVVLAERTELLSWLVAERNWYPSTTLTPAPVGTPYGVEGYKTIAHEVIRALGRTPTYVISPVAGGDLFYGTWKGFREYGALTPDSDAPLPRMVAAQSRECDPVVRGFQAGAKIVPRVEPHTIALSIGDPTSTPVSLTAIYESGGSAESVPDADIVATVRQLARLGLATEPSGAAAVAVALAMQRAGRFSENDDVVCIMTGAAVKWPDTISAGVDQHILNDGRLDAVRAWVASFDTDALTVA